MCHHVLFHVKWHVAAYNSRIVADGRLIFYPLFSLSWHIMYNIVLFVSYFSISVLFLLISYFIIFLFIEVFFCFQLSPSITIPYMFFLNFSPHSFNLWFHSYSFYRSFIFNLVLQLLFLICFSFRSSFSIFFPWHFCWSFFCF